MAGTYIALACVVLVGSLVKSTDAQFGPSDITRREGDRNEFIPCPFDGINTPFWKINDTFYHFSVLPCPFIASTNPSGLSITVVDRSISGTSFQCFAAGIGSIMASSIGVLTVTPDPLYGDDGVDMNTTLSIQLLGQQVWFNEREVFLSWSRFDKDTVVENDPGLRYVLYNSNCDISNNASVVENSTKNYACLSLGSFSDIKNVYFSISAIDEAGEQRSSINEPFRIDFDVVTENITQMIGSTCPVCVDVPQPENAPFFNIPRSSASNKADILCKAVRTPGEEGRCLDLTGTCDDFSQTPFALSLTVCSTTPTTTDYRMCFTNITSEMNSTKIHFFYSSSPTCSITGGRVTSRLYIGSYEVIAQDSQENINVALNESAGELCLTSLPSDCFSATVYNFTVTDVTGYATSTRMNIQDGECTLIDVPQLTDSECAPFNIAIDAYNPLVTYKTVYRTVGTGQTTSFCSCAQKRAQVNLRESTSGLNQIEISCSATLVTGGYGIMFFIVVMDGATNTAVFTSESISCTTNTKTLEITNTSCDRVYSVFAQFSFPNGSLSSCLLSNTTTINSTGVCPTSDAPTEGPASPTDNSTLAIVLPIVAVFVFAVIVAVIVGVGIVLKKRGSGTYSPRQAEIGSAVNLEEKSKSKKESVATQLPQEKET